VAKVGHTEINRLRDKAKTALGAKYDLRTFDDLWLKPACAAHRAGRRGRSLHRGEVQPL
jgi:hypothetical protein